LKPPDVREDHLMLKGEVFGGIGALKKTHPPTPLFFSFDLLTM